MNPPTYGILQVRRILKQQKKRIDSTKEGVIIMIDQGKLRIYYLLAALRAKNIQGCSMISAIKIGW
jgi:hypothetical protein